ncbi:hypothetical protein CLOM_g18428 [Closterium sp. NIES-68]|nr:hypothetical protein CLOM_g18428 [Closterium sp. NIES-68]
MSMCESSSDAGFPGVTHGIPSYLAGPYHFAGYGGSAPYHYGAPFPPMYGAPMHMPLPPHMTPPHMSPHVSAHAAAHAAAHGAHPSYGFPPQQTARHQPTRHPLHHASGPAKSLRRTGRSDRASMGHIPTPFFNDAENNGETHGEIDVADDPGGDFAGLHSSSGGGDPALDELSWGFLDSDLKLKLGAPATAKDVHSSETTKNYDHDSYYSDYPHAEYPMVSPYHPAYYQPHPLYSHHLFKQRHAEATAMARQARVAATREALAGRNSQSLVGRNAQSLKSPAVAQAKLTGKRKGGDGVAHSHGDGLEFDEQPDFVVAVASEPCAVVPSRADRSASHADLPLVPSSPSVPLQPAASAETASAFPAASACPSPPLARDRDGRFDFATRPSLPGDRDDATPVALFPPASRLPAAVSSPAVPSAVASAMPSAAASIPPTADPKRRRLLRNRVSAQQAREKKKYYITAMEGREAALSAENEKLEATIAALTRENAELRSRLRRRVVHH